MPPTSERPQITAEMAGVVARLQESAAVGQSFLAEFVRSAAYLQPGESLSCESTPTGGLLITRHPAPAFVSLERLSSELPDKPTPKRIERLCRDIHCRVVYVGKTPAVATEEFRRKLLEDAERREEERKSRMES